MSDMTPCDFCGARAECQPYGAEYRAADGVFIKEMTIPFAGTFVPQHSHAYDHTSLLVTGAVEVWADSRPLGTFSAPAAIFISAHVKHTFRSLYDKTTIYCIHNTMRTAAIEIVERHEFGVT